MAFQVTTEYLQSAAAACRTTAATVSDQLTTLRQYVVSLEDDVWQGAASNSFQELMQLYDGCAASLNQALTDMGTALQENSVNYNESEQDNLTKMQNIEGELSGARLG
jgi:WXG100 family type VII secretion target